MLGLRSTSWGLRCPGHTDLSAHAHAAIPGFGLTKGLVVELLPFVPASSSGRRVGSLCLVDPAELAST